MRTDEEPVIVSETYPSSAEEVWQAITAIDRMRKWYFDNIPDFQPVVGFRTRFDVDAGERQFPHLWEIEEVIPGRRIAYSWKFEGYPGRSRVDFDIEESDQATTLTVRCTVFEDFPDDVPEFARESCLGGWRYFLGERLKHYLAGEP